MSIKEEIKELAEKYFSEAVEIRRHIHSRPELSFEEYETSAFIVGKLNEWNVEYRDGIAKTGILARIDGKHPGKTIAFRADIDALPIQETNDVSYKSINEGKMHACGHDVHIAALLGAIRILNDMREHLSGTIFFVFQPAEERLPGGAKLMLDERLFGSDEPELMIAQHVYPDLEQGKVGFKEGSYMASNDEIYITVKGKGGHGAMPDELIDPVLIASQLILSLQQIVSRNASPGMPSVLSFGKVLAMGSVNVIPDEVRLEGTFRTLDESWRAKAHELINQIVLGICKAMGGNAEIEIRRGYPVLINDANITALAKETAIDYLGMENVEDIDIRMTAEDFAYFAQKYPSVLFRLGTAEQGKAGTPLHTSNFYVDENAIKISMGLLASLGVKFSNDFII